MAKETKAKKNYKKNHMAADTVARREIHKYKVKDQKKADKKAKVAAQAEYDYKVRQAKQKQVDDFVSQANTAKGPGYENMSVDDFFNEDFQDAIETKLKEKKATTKKKTTTPTPPAAVAAKGKSIPIPKALQALSVSKFQQAMEEDDEEEEYSEMEFSDEENDDETQFYNDPLDKEDGAGYDELQAHGVGPGEDDSEDDWDEDDLEELLNNEDDNNARFGGVKTVGEEFDDSDEELDPKVAAKRHQEELLALKKQDPELYKYLLKTQPELLNFKSTTMEDDDKDFAAEEKSNKKKQGKNVMEQKGVATNIEMLTVPQYQTLKKRFDSRQYSAKDVLILIKLFKSAVVVRKKTKAAQTKAANHGKNISQSKLNRMDMKMIELMNSQLYQHFLKFALTILPTAMLELLYLNNNIPIPFISTDDQTRNEKKALATNDTRRVSWKELSIALSDGISPLQGKWGSLAGWKKVSALARTYFLSVFSLLRETIDSSLIRLILRTILPAIPMLEVINIPVPLLLKRVLYFWCFTTDVEYKPMDKAKSSSTAAFRVDNTSRIEAFLVLRRLTMCLPHTSHVKEAVMKGMYQYYVRVCKHVTSYSYPTILFLTNCVTEMYGIDGILSYQLCFIYLRQLATQLRTYLIAPSSKALRNIYNWQFVNCLRMWGQILSTYAIEQESCLRPLIYPFAQIATTVLTLTQSPAYFPVKVTICQLLTTIMYKCQVYIPIATHLLQILRHPLFTTAQNKTKQQQITKHQMHLQNELTFKLHINSTLLNTNEYKQNIGEKIMDTLVYHLYVLADSVFYPEYSYPIRSVLKQLITMVKVPTLLADLKSLLLAMNETTQTIVDRRGKFAFSPRDVMTKNVNPLSLMANAIAINTLNQQAAAQDGDQQKSEKSAKKATQQSANAKQTSMHKLYLVRKAKADENDRFLRKEQQLLAAGEKEKIDAFYNEVDGEGDEDEDDEMEMLDGGEDEDDFELDDEDDEEEEEEEEEEQVKPTTKKQQQQLSKQQKQQQQQQKKRPRQPVDSDDDDDADDVMDDVQDFMFDEDF